MVIFKKIPKKIRIDYIFWIFLCVITLLLMTPPSSIFWEYINRIGSMLVVFGRLSLAISFFTSIIAGYFVISFCKNKKTKIFTYILLIIAIGYTILNWGHRTIIPEITDNILRKNVWNSTITEGTTAYFLNTKWSNINSLWFTKKPTKPLEILEGTAIIKQIKRTSNTHVYIINAQTPITIRENTLYFPGWTLKSDYKPTYIYPGKEGVINAKLSPGIQYLELIYEDILLYKIAKNISLIGFFIFIFSLAYFYFSKFKKIISFY